MVDIVEPTPGVGVTIALDTDVGPDPAVRSGMVHTALQALNARATIVVQGDVGLSPEAHLPHHQVAD